MRIIILIISGLITASIFFTIGSVLFWQIDIGFLLALILGVVAGSLLTYYYAKETRISKVLLRSSLVCLVATITVPLISWSGSIYQNYKDAFLILAVMFGIVFAVIAILAYVKARH